jgi:fluoride exporter
MIVLGIALGAAVGAAIRSRLSTFAWRATLGLNVAGSLVLGFITGLDPGDAWLTVVGTGFCGALTTFATFAFEAHLATRRRRTAIIVLNVVGCVGAASIGYLIASA